MVIVDPETGEKRYLGKWPAIIADRSDPLGVDRVRLIIPEVLGDVESDWALPCLPTAGGTLDAGQSIALRPGMPVWAEFLHGDKNKPIWTGFRAQVPPGARSTLPGLALGLPDESVFGKGTDSATAHTGDTIAEPPSAFAAEYPYNAVRKTEGGSIQEVDDTPGAERNSNWHPSGSYVETRASGSVVDKTVGNRAIITRGRHQEHRAQRSIEVYDDRVVRTYGEDLDEHVARNRRSEVIGTDTQRTTGKQTIEAGGLDVTIRGTEKRSISGALEETVAGGGLRAAVGPVDEVVLRHKSEYIGNAAQEAVARRLTIVRGDLLIEHTVQGGFTYSTPAGAIVISTLAGLLSLSAPAGLASLKGLLATLEATSLATVKGLTIMLDASAMIQLGLGAASPILLGTAAVGIFDGHTHPTGTPGTPTGTPQTSLAPALSTLVFAK